MTIGCNADFRFLTKGCELCSMMCVASNWDFVHRIVGVENSGLFTHNYKVIGPSNFVHMHCALDEERVCLQCNHSETVGTYHYVVIYQSYFSFMI